MYSCAQAAMIYAFTKQQWPVNNIMPLQRKAIDFLISLDISLFLLNLYLCGPTAFSPSTWSVHPVKATTITKTLPGISGFLLECTQRSCKFRVRYSKIVWKRVLRKVWTISISKDHIMPSISGRTKSLS